MRLPAWPGNVKKTSAVWQRPIVFYFSGLCLLLLGLLAGLYLFFPDETLKQRIIQEVEARTSVELQIKQVTLYPPLNLEARGVTLGVKDFPQPILIEALSIVPQWATLLTSDPGMQLHGQLMNGTVDADLLQSGIINATAKGLHFNLPLQKPYPVTISGTLNEIALKAATRLDPETKTSILARLSDVSIQGLEFLNAGEQGLKLGEIVLEADGQGRSILIKSLSAKGGDLIVSGFGNLLVGRTAATSRIRLDLQLRSGPNADPSLSTLLELAGKKDDEERHHLQLTGTLDKPLLQPGG